MASSSSSPAMKYQVFLSFRGEDTRLNFTYHLLKALQATGLNVFFDEDALEKGELLFPALSQGIAASRLSIIVLSSDYASSKSCLAELSDIMHRKETQGHIVLPIFYHVDPSDVRHLGGSFKNSFEDHESKRLHQLQRWKTAFAKVGELKGWHIQGGKFDRPDTKYIEDVVEHVIKILNRESSSVSEDLVGIDNKKKVILGLIEQEESRVIGLWGMGGIGKTTLAEAVYNEISPKFQSHYFLQNVREEVNNKGMKSVRNELLSKLLNSKIEIDTPTIVSAVIKERLKNTKLIVVLDDVDDSDQIHLMGVKHFGDGSKIIVTSRDRQVLINGGAVEIHTVKKLNKNDSLQLFSTFAFKQLHPAAEFRDLSYKFVHYADGSPLALKILGPKLYKKSREEWESEVDKLKMYAEPKISHILKSSFDGLNKLEQSIFLDIACFFKGEEKEDLENILSSYYKGAVSGISNLLDKSLLDITTYGQISMHDMLEEMGKDIICQESKYPGQRSRLWIPKDVYRVLNYNKGTELIEGIKLDMSQIDNLQLCPSVFKNMINLTCIHFYFPSYLGREWNQNLLANGVDIVYLSNELRFLHWEYYPFKSLPPNFNAKNLVVLKLRHGNMEQLWNEDDHLDLVNLMEIDVSFSKNLRKIPNLLGAINLKSLICNECKSLVELPCLSHLTFLEDLVLKGCTILKKFPELPNNFSELDISFTGIEEVPDSIEHLLKLKSLNLRNSGVKDISSNISKLESLQKLEVSYCEGLKSLPELPPYLWFLEANGCTSLERVHFTNHNLYQSHSLDDDGVFLSFSNCFGLNRDSIKNIGTYAMLQIQYLAQRLVSDGRYHRGSMFNRFICCFPENDISANELEHRSVVKIAPNGNSGSRFLAFAIFLVPNFSYRRCSGELEFKCKYQLTAARGKKFRSESVFLIRYNHYTGGHVFILFGQELIIKDNDYEEASFDFNIYDNRREDFFGVKKCVVHVFYVDAGSYVVSSATETIKFSHIGCE